MKKHYDIPEEVVSRDRAMTGKATGGTRHCRLEGCTGRRIGVRWPDKHITWPCSKGMVYSPDGKIGYIQ